MAFYITQSGGKVGFFILLLSVGFIYTFREKEIKFKFLIFCKVVLSFALFFGCWAFINELYTKPILKLQRPSHVYMLFKTDNSQYITALYNESKLFRQNYFEKLLIENPKLFENIDPIVKQHWIEEAGFSFPSGHTFNAFLFATIIAYAIYYNRKKPSLRKCYFVVFVWALAVAVSRVAIGAHSALDVCAGAALGIIVALVFLNINFTKYWLIHKK